MSELTASVGIAQLKKIDYILDKAKENKYKIKKAIENIVGIECRKFNDENGAQGDTLIFSLKSADDANRFEKILNNNGFATKILPEAIDWHFGGVWGHILTNFRQYKDVDLEKRYKKTGDKLRKSICLNIPILIKENEINNLIETIKMAESSIITV